MFSIKRLIIAAVVALYLYFLMPLTAVAFYELYHLTKIEAIYWGYGGFKAADYYLGVWGHKLTVSLGAALLVLVLPALFRKLRGV